MRLVEFYKKLQLILLEYYEQAIDEYEAIEQIEQLKNIATDCGLTVVVKPDVIKSIQVYESDYESESDYEDR